MVIFDINQEEYIAGNSNVWANWQSELSFNTCRPCAKSHGKIVDISILKQSRYVMAHPNCKCVYVPMRTKNTGTVTDLGNSGTDVYLQYHKNLPSQYITKEDAKKLGWISKKGNLDLVLPRRIIGGDVYKNKANELPAAPGRIWYEADINYYGGYRSTHRILYSNDGLMFATYDHYNTFYEILSQGE